MESGGALLPGGSRWAALPAVTGKRRGWRGLLERGEYRAVVSGRESGPSTAGPRSPLPRVGNQGSACPRQAGRTAGRAPLAREPALLRPSLLPAHEEPGLAG
ncbi:hypothetical protein JRQ81_000483 [Phrynocephalus forsythii]|uniref:Uncharacterized protein n=1 Tax=Phrynocephalus forsythii TaxID=171643 RepID=A0A9Q0Y982_9SAUR|nr:hypothetical protein JRQ81_000483 [Phrynocephalus forsythii]